MDKVLDEIDEKKINANSKNKNLKLARFIFLKNLIPVFYYFSLFGTSIFWSVFEQTILPYSQLDIIKSRNVTLVTLLITYVIIGLYYKHKQKKNVEKYIGDSVNIPSIFIFSFLISIGAGLISKDWILNTQHPIIVGFIICLIFYIPLSVVGGIFKTYLKK